MSYGLTATTRIVKHDPKISKLSNPAPAPKKPSLQQKAQFKGIPPELYDILYSGHFWEKFQSESKWDGKTSAPEAGDFAGNAADDDYEDESDVESVHNTENHDGTTPDNEDSEEARVIIPDEIQQMYEMAAVTFRAFWKFGYQKKIMDSLQGANKSIKESNESNKREEEFGLLPIDTLAGTTTTLRRALISYIDAQAENGRTLAAKEIDNAVNLMITYLDRQEIPWKLFVPAPVSTKLVQICNGTNNTSAQKISQAHLKPTELQKRELEKATPLIHSLFDDLGQGGPNHAAIMENIEIHNKKIVAINKGNGCKELDHTIPLPLFREKVLIAVEPEKRVALFQQNQEYLRAAMNLTLGETDLASALPTQTQDQLNNDVITKYCSPVDQAKDKAENKKMNYEKAPKVTGNTEATFVTGEASPQPILQAVNENIPLVNNSTHSAPEKVNGTAASSANTTQFELRATPVTSTTSTPPEMSSTFPGFRKSSSRPGFVRDGGALKQIHGYMSTGRFRGSSAYQLMIPKTKTETHLVCELVAASNWKGKVEEYMKLPEAQDLAKDRGTAPMLKGKSISNFSIKWIAEQRRDPAKEPKMGWARSVKTIVHGAFEDDKALGSRNWLRSELVKGFGMEQVDGELDTYREEANHPPPARPTRNINALRGARARKSDSGYDTEEETDAESLVGEDENMGGFNLPPEADDDFVVGDDQPIQGEGSEERKEREKTMELLEKRKVAMEKAKKRDRDAALKRQAEDLPPDGVKESIEARDSDVEMSDDESL